jgi:hypothetical protein
MLAYRTVSLVLGVRAEADAKRVNLATQRGASSIGMHGLAA